MPSDRRSRIVRLGGALLGIGVTALAGALIAIRHGDPGVGADAAWTAFVQPLRTPLPLGVSSVLADVGGAPGSIVVAVGVGLAILWRRGLRSALAFAGAAVLSEGLVRVLKTLEPRIGPSGGYFEGIGSFPSGHTANAAVLAVTLVVLHDRPWTRVVAVAYVVVMALSRTLLHAHWLTDTLGGALVGIASAVLVWTLAAHRRPRGGVSGA